MLNGLEIQRMDSTPRAPCPGRGGGHARFQWEVRVNLAKNKWAGLEFLHSSSPFGRTLESWTRALPGARDQRSTEKEAETGLSRGWTASCALTGLSPHTDAQPGSGGLETIRSSHHQCAPCPEMQGWGCSQSALRTPLPSSQWLFQNLLKGLLVLRPHLPPVL